MRPETKKLRDTVLKEIDAAVYFEEQLGPDARFGGKAEVQIWCPFHDDEGGKHKSMSLHKSGKFYCHSPSCGVYGSNIIHWHEKSKKLKFVAALRDLYGTYVTKTVPESVLKGFQANLEHTKKILQWVRQKRGLSLKDVRQFGLGFDNRRVILPVRDQFGMLVNLRRYDPTGKEKYKMISYAEGYGNKRLFPIKSLKHKTVVLCEGEWDALVACSRGIPAVTSTGGVKSWDKSWTERFKNRRVIICFDVNDGEDEGQEAALKRAQMLSNTAEWVKVVKLPLKKKGGDLSDYFVKHGKTKADFMRLVKNAPVIHPVEGQDFNEETDETVFEVTLGQASAARYFNRRIRMRTIVAGKDLAPYLPPKTIKVRCSGATSEQTECAECVMANYDFDHEFEVAEDPKQALRLIDRPDHILKSSLKTWLGIPSKCKVRVETAETFNVEHVQLIPEIDYSDKRNPYVLRDAYFIGHGLTPNRAYQFEGYTVPEPFKQYATHILVDSQPAQSNIDTFRMTKELRKELTIFQPDKDRTIEEQLNHLYKHLAINATRIFERPLLHQAIDLVFHSPLTFRFNGEQVRKGWLDVLVLGDTRTGKGYVAEGLIRFYQLGEIVSAENCSFAGLVGGMQQVRNRWVVTWGKIPLNDGRIVVVDEASALGVSDWERLSRVRSEGIAEIVKIQTETTTARTRLIWLANPRSGAPMNTYSTGVEAIIELVGKTEDVARFDYAVTVASNEVPSAVINRSFAAKIKSPYTALLCRQLVLWTWSRKASQIRFTRKATTTALKAAQTLGKAYSAVVPLIQVENVRLKIVKIAAAIAGRTFSTDVTGEKLIITRQHVDAAVSFLNRLYTRPSMAYDQFSRTVLDRTTLKKKSDVDRLIDNLEGHALDFVEGCLEQNEITLTDIADYAGADRDRARAIVSALVRQRALRKEHGHYQRSPPSSRT
jgi:hypothetical protein